MLNGVELGRAIDAARTKKGITKKALAAEFGVKPPSVQDWIKLGRISKEHIDHLFEFFSDVVGQDHWGLTSSQSRSSSHEITERETKLLAKVRQIEASGVAPEEVDRLLDFALASSKTPTITAAKATDYAKLDSAFDASN